MFRLCLSVAMVMAAVFGANAQTSTQPESEMDKCHTKMPTLRVELEQMKKDLENQIAKADKVYKDLIVIEKQELLRKFNVSAASEQNPKLSRYAVPVEMVEFDIKKADETCKVLGGFLVEIDDEPEFRRLATYLTGTLQLSDNDVIFSGLNDIKTEGTYRNYRHSDLNAYVKWRNNEPNDFKGREDCVQILPGEVTMNDTPCKDMGKFVCELVEPLN